MNYWDTPFWIRRVHWYELTRGVIKDCGLIRHREIGWCKIDHQPGSIVTSERREKEREKEKEREERGMCARS